MKSLPLIIPLLFMLYVALGLAEPKTIIVSMAFALSIIYGIEKGKKVSWRDNGLNIEERYIEYAFWVAIAIIGVQIIRLGTIPLLRPSVRTHLDPILTALTYFLGMPSSVYLFRNGKKYSLLYTLLVALYAYRTPVLVSAIALGAVYYESKKRDTLKMAAITILGAALFGIITHLRGNGISSLWVRLQSTISVLDIIVWRGGWNGYYKGTLQWAGVKSYLIGGYAPRGLVAKFLYVHTGATITPTLLGGMYLDFGIFALIEGFLLGVYYGMISKAEHPFTKAIYYTTLAYGIVGVETGILDLPVYALFAIGGYILYRGWKGGTG